MNSRTTATEDRLAGLFRAARLFVFLTLAAVAAVYAWIGRRFLPHGGAAAQDTQAASAPTAAAWPEPTSFEPSSWAVFRSGQAPTAQGPLASRFRLAGTFFVYADEAGGPRRVCKAILDDVQEKRQYLVAEGDLMGDVEVRRILTDRVILYAQGREEELFLSFMGLGKEPPSASGAPVADGTAPEDALETTAFGKRVGENRWVIQREALLGYYEQMKNDPERVALLYETFKPDYRPDGTIAGYRLGIEGEREFLEAIGLKEGDAIRKVNSLQMSSQSRAEYFISEFARDRLGAVVLDLERDGKSQKLIYMIR